MEPHPIKVLIRGFQSIEELDFDICGFTCVTGKSNIGKSAIIRAISRSIMNSPVVGLVRKGSKFSTVELISDKWRYKWEKGEGNSGVNRYKIGDRVLDKTGQNQLTEIKNMGFGSIRIGDDNIHPWWASQFDPIFLLDKSGPHVTEFITEVSKLKTLQNAIACASKQKNRNNEIAKLKANEIIKVKNRQSNIENLENVNNASIQLDEQIESIESYEQRLIDKNNFLSAIRTTEKNIKQLDNVSLVKIPKISTDIEQKIASIISMHTYWIELEKVAKSIIVVKMIKQVIIPEMPNINKLRSIISFSIIIELKKSVNILNGVTQLPILNDADLNINVVDLRNKRKYLNEIQKLSLSIEILNDIINIPELQELQPLQLQEMNNHLKAIKTAKELLEFSTKELQIAILEITNLEEELNKIPVCPSCKRPIMENHESHGDET